MVDLSHYATKKELNNAAVADASNLAAKGDSLALKTSVNKLHINKLVNVPTSLNKSSWFRSW